MANVIVKQERERGCGYRKGGGIYLVNDGPGQGCGRMPIPLHVCPTCSQGIKPARGWTWIDSKPILDAAPICKHKQLETAALNEIVDFNPDQCETCPMSGRLKETKVGLMWVGGKFYARPEDFIAEAHAMGLSKRISQVPKEFIVGQTWVWLAHRETIAAAHPETCATERMMSDYEFRARMIEEGMVGVLCDCGAKPTPGVFHAFVPTRIEYVIKGDETEPELDALEKRGLTLVKVERIDKNGDLVPDESANTNEDDDGN
jgi:hypothetical protein